MKKLLIGLLALCVVAPASFGATYEYTWSNAANGNFTDTTWTCNLTGGPATPFEKGAGPLTGDTARPQLTNGATITVNTNVAPLNVGFNQFQTTKGDVVIENGGRMGIGAYLFCSNNNSNGNAGFNGLTVKSGGTYFNNANTGSQSGHMFVYTTAAATGVTTLEAGSNFTSKAVYLARDNGSYAATGKWNILGSGSAINVNYIMTGGGVGGKLTYKFASDAGGISTVCVNNTATTVGRVEFAGGARGASTSILDFQLGAAPIEGQQFVLFDLAAGAISTGKLTTLWGTTIDEGGLIDVWYGDTMYGLHATYKGGDTGNDVILTVVPEPATLAVLGLGGLLLRRRLA